MESAEKFLGRKKIDFSNVELPNFQPYCALPRLQILNLSHNHLKEFPQLVTMHATRLVHLLLFSSVILMLFAGKPGCII